jgi:hypothetical protein
MVATVLDIHRLATQLHALMTSGHEGLMFYVNAPGRASIWLAGEAAQGFDADIVARHLTGRYVAAPAAPRWVQWACIAIDGRVRVGESEEEARLRGQRLLGRVWRALDASAERHPLVELSPDGEYRLWLPLTRGDSSTSPSHTWPTRLVNEWVLQRLVSMGLWRELFGPSAALAVYPSRRCVPAPCGRAAVLLQAAEPHDPDALGFVPWPETERDHIDTRTRDSFPGLALRAFVFMDEWERQRRTLADWLGEPDAAWHPGFGEEHHDSCGDDGSHAYLRPSGPDGSRDGDLD